MRHGLSPSEFAAKWLGSSRNERASAQEHFIDLCRMLGEPTPNEADPSGDWYAFEKGARKESGGDGFADVWKRGHFAWEYKGKRKDLDAAYKQLLQYREALENPPLLVVCDLDLFHIHTNFTGTKKEVHTFSLQELRDAPAQPLRILRAVMHDPASLRPTETRQDITERAAGKFAALARKLQNRGHEPHHVAHFLNRLLFCLFAEDARVLPHGLLTRLIEKTRSNRRQLFASLSELFSLMSEGGGWFGTDEIEWFNGGLFDGSEVLELLEDELADLAEVARLDWSNIEPAILGTLFERGLDPAKRSQLGAHYTDRAAILRVVEPVVFEPLRREFEAVKTEVLALHAKEKAAKAKKRSSPALKRYQAFLDRLRAVTVLDPACGSGNFLYVSLQLLKDLEKEVIRWGADTLETTREFPQVGPQNILGIELNPYAAELARVSVWIGEIQWMINNGYSYSRDPILKSLERIECRDAVLARDDDGTPRRPDWPEAEFIVGNPPFLGGKKMRRELGDEYVEALFAAWEDGVPSEADFVCYWHERARELIEKGKVKRAGLLSTNSIRGGASRKVLERIKETGDIFMAWADEEWVVEGAAVRVSIVAQDDGSETHRTLDGKPIGVIHPDLTGGDDQSVNLTSAKRLPENEGVSFMGDTKGGAFDVDEATAAKLLADRGNPNGRPNSDVVVPWVNGLDITRRPRGMWIIDFGVDATQEAVADYAAPFKLVENLVRPIRGESKRDAYRKRWWIHMEPRPAMRAAYAPLSRYLATARVAKHRLFVWLRKPTLPDSQVIVIAREDDFAFGVLHSRVHQLWSLRMCSWLGMGNDPRYTPSTTFETFPFPWPLNVQREDLSSEQLAHEERIAAAARELDLKRNRWLNPPEWLTEAPPLAPGLPARQVAKDEVSAKELAKRTLTKLYNERPAWLDNLHRSLDEAVIAAYGWPADVTDDDILRRLLDLNHARAGALKAA